MGARTPSKKKSLAKSADCKREHRAKRPANSILKKAARLAAVGQRLMPDMGVVPRTKSEEEEAGKWSLPVAIEQVRRDVVDGKPFDSAVKTAARSFALNPVLVKRKFVEQHGSVKEVLKRARFLSQPTIKRAEREREQGRRRERQADECRKREAKRSPVPIPSYDPALDEAWKEHKRRLADLAEVVSKLLEREYWADSGKVVKGAPLSAIEKHLEMIDWPSLGGLFSNRSLEHQLLDAGFQYVPVRKNKLKFMVITL